MPPDEEMDGYAKIDMYNPAKVDKLAGWYKNIIEEVGEKSDREGLLKTPERVAKAMQFLTHGYDLDPVAILNSAKFKEDYKQMVIVKDIELYSLCEHHMLPFFGKCMWPIFPIIILLGSVKFQEWLMPFPAACRCRND